MIRHFLGVMFWSFIGMVVFVNLFQFSGALLPFESNAVDVTSNWQHSYFGFTSIFRFVKALGSSDSGLNVGLNIMNQGIKTIQQFSINDIVDFFNNLKTLEQENPALIVVYIFSFLLNLIKDLLILPIIMIVGLVLIAIGIIIFAWNLLSFLFLFLLGHFNVPYHPVTL